MHDFLCNPKAASVAVFKISKTLIPFKAEHSSKCTIPTSLFAKLRPLMLET